MSGIRNSDAENLKADIVVIGGGGAGLPAAIAAAEAGAKNIILLEKRRTLGGNARRAIVMFAVESPAQKRIGETFTRDEVFKEKMDFGSWTVDPRVVRTLVNTTAEIIEWLENKGLRFDRLTDHGFRGQYPKLSHMLSQNPEERLGERLIETLSKNCRDLGVQILLGTAGKKILTDKKGKVTGVLAVKKGKEIRIAAKAVIIAAGGFTGNKEMMDKYLPAKGFRLSLSLPYTGDGLGMAAEVGAVIDDVITQPLMGAHHYPYAARTASLNQLIHRPEMILVNKRGERFYDEAFVTRGGTHFGGNALARQPDEICYALIDSEALQSMIKKKELYTEMDEFFLYGGSGGFGVKPGTGAQTTWFDKLYGDFKIDAEKGVAKIANTWDEVAEYIGAKPEVLKATIEQYNFYCDQGYDADFLKDKEFLLPLRTPPYYAILGRQGYDCTLGGIKINQFMEVINKKHDPISGLYAAGDNAGSCISRVYHMKHAGTTLSFAIGAGYLAGKNATKYVSGKG
jgi:fumarate reductase flavoprotein subunit